MGSQGLFQARRGVNVSKKRGRLPRQLILFLMPIGCCIGIVLVETLIFSPDGLQAKQELENDFQAIHPHPAVTQIAYGAGHKFATDIVEVKADYLTEQMADSTLPYYDSELTKLGWRYWRSDWDSWAKLVYYCKGDYTAELDFEDSSYARQKESRYFHITFRRGFRECEGIKMSITNAMSESIIFSSAFAVCVAVIWTSLRKPELIKELGLKPGYVLIIQSSIVGLIAATMAIYGYYQLWQRVVERWSGIY